MKSATSEPQRETDHIAYILGGFDSAYDPLFKQGQNQYLWRHSTTCTQNIMITLQWLFTYNLSMTITTVQLLLNNLYSRGFGCCGGRGFRNPRPIYYQLCREFCHIVCTCSHRFDLGNSGANVSPAPQQFSRYALQPSTYVVNHSSYPSTTLSYSTMTRVLLITQLMIFDISPFPVPTNFKLVMVLVCLLTILVTHLSLSPSC